jgi:hypothetical protein
MSAVLTTGRELAASVLNHLLERLACTPPVHEPFSHIYLEDVFPRDVYEHLLTQLPDPTLYNGTAERHYGHAQHGFVRWMFALTPDRLAKLTAEQREFWRAIGAALIAPELKRAMFTKLSKDLAFRYGVPESETADLPGHARPTLYRETAGFEIPPHPDTRKKIVTMHLYCPADRSQLDLGTALYRRRLLAWPLGDWKRRFEKVKQFVFQPNSGYAFVVNNALRRKSWHGREKLPPGAGVRNTILNTFYEQDREAFGSYL